MTDEPDVFDYYSDSKSEPSSRIVIKPALLVLILLTLATVAVFAQVLWLNSRISYLSDNAEIRSYILSVTERPLLILIPCAYILAIATLAGRTAVACSILSIVVNALALAATVPIAVFVSRWDEWYLKFPFAPAFFALSVAAASVDLRDKIKYVHERP